MFKIDENDFFPIEDLKYLSRWTELNGTALPSDIIAQIRAIKEEKSIQLWESLYVVCGIDLYNLIFPSLRDKVDLNKFATISCYSAGENTVKEVSHWLSSLAIPLTGRMVFCWEPDVAVTTTWEIFVNYWDDFCYLGQDDVFISSIEGPWRLLFFHEGDVVCGQLISPSAG